MNNYTNMKKRLLAAPHHFALLEVHLGSTEPELKAAHRRLAKLFHPDVNSDPAAAGIMASVNVAYTLLLDTRKRGIYAKCLGPKCVACKGQGYTQKQKGFSKVVFTTCHSCQGAGHAAKL